AGLNVAAYARRARTSYPQVTRPTVASTTGIAGKMTIADTLAQLTFQVRHCGPGPYERRWRNFKAERLGLLRLMTHERDMGPSRQRPAGRESSSKAGPAFSASCACVCAL